MFTKVQGVIGALICVLAFSGLAVYMSITEGDSIALGLVACLAIFSPLWWAANIDPFD